MASEKRVVFRSGWLPWALLAPQVIVILVFFFWPAAQALLQSFQQSDAFGISTEWVGLQNFENLLKDDTYLASFQATAVFSVLVAGLGIGISLVLAVFADRVVKATLIYRTLLIWPYAVAPAVAGVLQRFPTHEMAEGDAYLMNDPWSGGTHLPDLIVVSPVLSEGRVIALAATILHPVQQALLAPVEWQEQAAHYLMGLDEARKAQLEAEQLVASQAERVMRSAQLELENAQLRDLLALRPRVSVQTLSAEVLYDAKRGRARGGGAIARFGAGDDQRQAAAHAANSRRTVSGASSSNRRASAAAASAWSISA